jgi:TatD DNase family protein
MEEFEADRDHVIQKAFHENIAAILCPAEITEADSLRITLDLINKYPNIIASAGVHPHSARDFSSDCIKKIKELARAKKIRAVGEIGLDFHYDFSPHTKQIQVFRMQLNAAQQLDLPVVVHSRMAGDAIAKAVEKEHFTRGGVLHCFTEEWEFASQMMDHGFFISFSGILTFSGAHALRETAKKIPLKRLLTETDSPYLVPEPFRGRIPRNEPLYVREVAKILADLKGISLDELAAVTTENFESLFLFEITKAG